MVRYFCKEKWFVKYKDALDTVDTDLQRNLDILTLLRRLKMHGLALSVLLDNPSRRFISNQSFTKPLDYVRENTKKVPDMLWLRFELLSRGETVMVALFRRYLELKNAEAMQERGEQETCKLIEKAFKKKLGSRNSSLTQKSKKEANGKKDTGAAFESDVISQQS